MTDDECKIRIEREVGKEWLKLVNKEELEAFNMWALEGQVLFYPGNETILGAAFRGFATACKHYHMEIAFMYLRALKQHVQPDRKKFIFAELERILREDIK